jgi:nicotinate-nucleotide adenylyltransferase
MRVGVFGGSFDPVHYGHLLLAECCREECQLDRVLFMPTAVPPHKQGCVLTAAAHRVAMLELAISGNPGFDLSQYEVHRGGVNYTVDTLMHLHDQQPEVELFFLMGADMLFDLPHWRNASMVCQLALPIAVRRGRSELDLTVLHGIASPERIAEIRQHQVAMPPVEISGTDIRRRVAHGRSIRYQTAPAVVQYIAEHGLYREGALDLASVVRQP